MSEMKGTATRPTNDPALPVGRLASGAIRARDRHLVEEIGGIVAFVVVAFFAIIFIFPLFWMISTSLKTLPEVFHLPPDWWPAKMMWSNYPTSLQMFPFWRYAWNTLRITIPVTVGVTLSSSLVAYSFSRLRWPGRDIVFYLVLATLMIPNWVTLIPLYILYNNFGWINTYNPLIIPAFFGDAFSIFLLRQFFMRQPQDLVDAARVDGANHLIVFARLIVPLSRPALTVVALFAFINTWTDFFNPLIYLSNPDLYTLQLGLYSFFAQHYVNWPGLMVASTVILAPIAILFFFAQRTFIEGITFTGLRG